MGLKFCISDKLPSGGDAVSPWHFIVSFLVARVTFHPVTAKSIAKAFSVPY